MFKFSHQQFRQFEAGRRNRYELLALAHVKQYFADRLAALGEEPSRALLQHALRQAEAERFVLQAEVLKYVNLIFEFGPDFGRTPAYDWAREIIDDTAGDRMARLYAESVSRLNAQG